MRSRESPRRGRPARLPRSHSFVGQHVFVALAAAAAAADGQTGPHRHAVDPGAVLRAPGELLAAEEQPHEDFLGRIVGVLFVAQQAKTDPPHPLPKAVHQRDEGRPIGTFAGGRGGQLFVGQRGRIHGTLTAMSCRPRRRGHNDCSGFCEEPAAWGVSSRTDRQSIPEMGEKRYSSVAGSGI